MNWQVVKRKFPKSYNEIREFSDKTGLTGRPCYEAFLNSKGYEKCILRIGQLRDYENKLK